MKNWMVFTVVLFMIIVGCIPLSAQDSLYLNNPSFEDTPRHSKVPEGWVNCGFKEESPPDIGPTDFFRAKTQASHGQTHLVMVARDIGSWERIGNPLSSALKAGVCYHFSLDLARSPVYLSVSRATKTAINFNRPIRIRIWGANEEGELQELLAVSETVEHEDWQRYTFYLCPLASHSMLVLETMYAAGAEQPYAGNIMLDNCSALLETTSVHRDELRLQEWNAEVIPGNKTITDIRRIEKNPELADTLLLGQYMDDIQKGRIDIGLTNLATYAIAFDNLPWFVIVKEQDEERSKEQLRTLRKRIKAMGFKAILRVKPEESIPKDFQYLVDDLGWSK